MRRIFSTRFQRRGTEHLCHVIEGSILGPQIDEEVNICFRRKTKGAVTLFSPQWDIDTRVGLFPLELKDRGISVCATQSLRDVSRLI
jgi:hypothetical protein